MHQRYSQTEGLDRRTRLHIDDLQEREQNAHINDHYIFYFFIIFISI